jgi:hypothetical protein
MEKIKLLLLVCVLVAGCAQTKKPDFSRAPQVEMPGMPDTITAASICHHYADHNLFTKKLEEIKLTVNEEEKNKQIRYLQLELYAECIVNLQGVLNDYKNSI